MNGKNTILRRSIRLLTYNWIKLELKFKIKELL